MAGTFVAQRNLQAAAWGVDGVALIVGAALIASKFSERDAISPPLGFLVPPSAHDMGLKTPIEHGVAFGYGRLAELLKSQMSSQEVKK